MYTGLRDSLVEALLTTSTRQSRGMSWVVVAKARAPGIERELQMYMTWLLGFAGARSAEGGELNMAPSSLFLDALPEALK